MSYNLFDLEPSLLAMLQRLISRLIIARGRDPDFPCNLSKSLTVD
jgi:hypothetical protein